MCKMAKRIRECRTQKQLTQEELANKLGLKKSAIAKYENGRVENIKRTTIEEMANIFGCKPSYLMGWDTVSDNDIGNIFANDNLFEVINNMSVLSPQEKNHFTNYLHLIEINRKKADNYVEQLLSLQQMDKALQADAAHARTDIEIPEGIDISDNDIMDDENF